MKRIALNELLKNRQQDSYIDQYQYVIEKIQRDEIRPIKNSSLNGKKPALHIAYWIVEKEQDYSDLSEELKFGLPPGISTDYYLTNLKVYKKEQNWVRLLGKYMNNQDKDENTISMNERSFQIWGHEKFLQKGNGKTVLKHCGLTMDTLNIYQTSEPLAYYTASRQTPQTILIIENKDTFYSMRRYLMERGSNQKMLHVLGQEIHTLVYGAGKGILRSIEDFKFCVEPSETKEGQNRNISGHFYHYFESSTVEIMKQVLEANKYIPQECLNITDF